MPTVTLKVDEQTRDLWVEAAHQERVTLSEWIRKACLARAQPAERPLVIHTSEELAEQVAIVPLALETVVSMPEPLPETKNPVLRAGPLPEFKADPKDKAAQEHAKGQKKKAAGGLCPHRVPLDRFCKRCGK